MARIQRLPAQHVIDGFRGVLDFYESMGLYIVRTWPRGKSLPQTTQEVAAQPIFARCARLKPLYSATIESAARRYSLGGTSTWQDNLTRAYYGRNVPSAMAL